MGDKTQHRPFPERERRHEQAGERRAVAARFSSRYASRETRRNDDEERLAAEDHGASFTKGLPHGPFGMLESGDAYDSFVKEINQQDATDFSSVPRGLDGTRADGSARAPLTCRHDGADIGWRGWESPRAGHYYDLQGPDADAVGMPPAPTLGSEELIAEMGEVYALALLRDVPFACIADGSGEDAQSGIGSAEVLDALAALSWFADGTSDALSLQERRRRAARRLDHGEALPIDAPPDDTPFEKSSAFRGSGPACKAGPYVSQFMLLGNDHPPRPDDPDTAPPITAASVAYGVQRIDQRIESFAAHRDFMLHWNAYLDVQNGADVGDATTREMQERRFIATPRDLAAYVRFDALYQAYLNACLFMLEEKLPFQQPVPHPHTGRTGPGFPDRASDGCGQPSARTGFAAFGGPHVLSLVTEVATRCLKAVRRQKFNYHRRCRPERIGALLTVNGAKGVDGVDALGTATREALDTMASDRNLGPLLELVARHNAARLAAGSADPHLDFEARPDACWLAEARNLLLPMAFAEGSPMHPSYGAGHATVAGGCVTMLKAFFDTVDADGRAIPWPSTLPVVQASADGRALEHVVPDPGMTLSGELNKLAANISIGRNMAGVHYYTDYYESLRMGERIATGILIEQMKQYNEPVEMDFESFDGDHVHILKLDYDYADPRVFVHDAQGRNVPFDTWWHRHLSPEPDTAAAPAASDDAPAVHARGNERTAATRAA